MKVDDTIIRLASFISRKIDLLLNSMKFNREATYVNCKTMWHYNDVGKWAIVNVTCALSVQRLYAAANWLPVVKVATTYGFHGIVLFFEGLPHKMTFLSWETNCPLFCENVLLI